MLYLPFALKFVLDPFIRRCRLEIHMLSLVGSTPELDTEVLVMIACPTVRKSEIQNHYDLATLFYRLLWGEHIHHGLWDGDESPELAQRQLIDRQVAAAGIERGARVLDVGCGMGGTAMYLARELGCEVTAVTLSPVQRLWATVVSRLRGLGRQTHFLQGDAEKLSLAPDSFDVVWSVECTEHLYDKPGFFGRAARWLRPGGKVAVCAWLAGDDPLSREASELVGQVCEGFLCPSLGSAAEYQQWMQAAELTMLSYRDVTAKVDRTWEICLERTRSAWVQRFARRAGASMDCFLHRFATILRAYRTGAMKYGCFVAERSASAPVSSVSRDGIAQG
jgi:tocopherol O-methyltransferase